MQNKIRKNKKLILLVTSYCLLVTCLVFPQFVFAKGLVPCGGQGEPMCTLCDFATLANNIIEFMLFKLILPIGTLVLMYAGIMFMANASNPGNIEKAKKIFSTTIIGIVIALSAWLVINTIMVQLIRPGHPISEGWTQFPNCERGIF